METQSSGVEMGLDAPLGGIAGLIALAVSGKRALPWAAKISKGYKIISVCGLLGK